MAFKMKGFSGFQRGSIAASKDSLKTEDKKQNEKYAYLKGKSASETMKNLLKNPKAVLDMYKQAYITTGKNLKNYFTTGKSTIKNYITRKNLERFEKYRSKKLGKPYVPASKKNK